MVQIVFSNFIDALTKSSTVDNFVFRLYYRWTVLILVVFSFIATSRTFLGNSFSCGDSDNETFCYDENVYTSYNKSIDFRKQSTEGTSPFYLKYHKYYCWVNLFLLVHAFNFSLPHLLWKSYEGGHTGLNADAEFFFAKEEKRRLDHHGLAKYVLLTEGKHKLYTATYIFLEVCNYACSLSHTIWLVMFFDVTGVPTSLSVKLITWADFRNFYFPFIVTCTDFSYELRIHTTCLLPMNNLYMKMFLFIHTWYIFITILCGIVLMYRIALLVPSFRVHTMNFTGSLADKSIVKSLCHRSSYSDFFFLTRLQKVMVDIDFAQMIDKLSIISQCKSIDDNNDQMSSVFEEMSKEFNSSTATSPV